MEQMDLFESEVDVLKKQVLKLAESLESTRRGAFHQITCLRKELESLNANCEVMSDELFRKQLVS